MDYILIGPPGCGKGTQSEYLKEQDNIAHIATGDLLRECATGEDAICKKINASLESGEMLEDSMVIELVEKTLAKYSNKVIVFDGFPRTLSQAHLLDDMLAKLGRKIGKVIYFKIDDQKLVDRVVNRMMCPNCGRIYNKLSHKPRVAGMCDDCGGVELVVRKDDDATVLKERLKNFHELTEPLVGFYEERGQLKCIDASMDQSDVRAEIAKIIN